MQKHPKHTPLLDLLVFFLCKYSPIEEEWREIQGTQGKYFVSNRGRVLSLCQNKYKTLKPYVCGDGYYYVNLNIDGQWKNKRVNILVADYFLEKPEAEKLECHHKDTQRLNNDVNNLEWLTPEEHRKKHKELREQLNPPAEDG